MARDMIVWRVLVCVALIAVGPAAWAQQRPAYAWDMPQDELVKFDKLTYQSGAIALTIDSGKCGPIVIQVPDEEGNPQPQVTGLEIIGEGQITVEHEGQVLLQDQVHGAMLRFHPEDADAFVKMEGETPVDDAGLRALLMHLCYGSFRRFWHRGMEAFIPDRSVGAAWVYASEHGGVMVWQNEKELGAYCMDTKTELFKK